MTAPLDLVALFRSLANGLGASPARFLSDPGEMELLAR